MKKEKKFTVQINGRNNSTRTTTGTIQELTEYFSYTLEVGNSWDPKVNRNPKTIKALVSNVNRAYDASTGNGYSGKSIEQVENPVTSEA